MPAWPARRRSAAQGSTCCARSALPWLPASRCTASTPDTLPTSAPSWDEALDRLGARLPAGRLADSGRLVWFDRTAGDRWGPLAGGEGTVGLPGPLAAACGGPAGPEQAAGAERLLVTSHRPLEHALEAAWAASAAPRGFAVGVGHPALGEDLKALLPAGWQVVWLPEFPRLGGAQKV